MRREDISHELRTPLTTVKGVLQLLASGRLGNGSSEHASELIGRAWQQVVKLEAVVGRVEALFHDGPDTEEAFVVIIEEGSPGAGR